MSTLALTLAPPRSRAVARAGYQVVCAVAGSFLIAGLAQVHITLSFTPVPISGQTLGVLLVGAAYGPGLGAATLVLYLAWAVVGLPVLAPQADGSHRTGADVLGLASVTAGYLWGFVLASALVGWLSRKGWDRSVRSSIGVMFLGSVVLYAVGLPWLRQALPAGPSGGPATWQGTFEAGLYPFVIGDTLKLLAAAGLLPVAWRLIDRFRPGGR
jgi:biotin transport system substrate-specific component